MADGNLISVGAEQRVQVAVMEALRSDLDVKQIFGDRPRVYDDETRAPAFPFAKLERHETRPAGAAGVPGQEHIFTFAVSSRFGGRATAKEGIGVLRAAVERADITLEGQRIVLAYASYGDVFRAPDGQTFRGIVRFRIISEEIV